ncbi:MAG: hypothetical protein ACRCU6_05745 [Fusobacteriaceae bacterium]
MKDQINELLFGLTIEESLQLDEIMVWAYRNKNKISLSRLAEICGIMDLSPIRKMMGEGDFIIEGSETFLTNWKIICEVLYLGELPCLVKARKTLDEINGN